MRNVRGILVLMAILALVACSKGSEKEKVSSGIFFMRVSEPREGAFTILVPRGWQIDGGIYRMNAAKAGGPLNAIEAKCDLLFIPKVGLMGGIYSGIPRFQSVSQAEAVPLQVLSTVESFTH